MRSLVDCIVCCSNGFVSCGGSRIGRTCGSILR
jgi:hypothetical protein